MLYNSFDSDEFYDSGFNYEEAPAMAGLQQFTYLDTQPYMNGNLDELEYALRPKSQYLQTTPVVNRVLREMSPYQDW
jgi:hypothetical protein